MEEGVRITVDVKASVCRLCISKKGEFQIAQQIRRNIEGIFGITISRYDGLSQTICRICKKLLLEIMKLRKKFIKNQEILRQKIKQLVTEEDKSFPVIAKCNSELSGEIKMNETSAEIKVIQKPTKSYSKNDVRSKININLQKNTPCESPITISPDSDLKKLISDSDGDDIKLNTLQKRFNYVCRVCDDSFNTKTKMYCHLKSEHKILNENVLSECIPCSVRLNNISLREQKTKNLVRLRPSKILKFTPSDPLYYLVKSGKPEVIIDSSSKDSDSSVSNTSYRQILSKPNEIRKHIYVDKLDDTAKKILQELASKLSEKDNSRESINVDFNSSTTPPDVLDNGEALTEEDIDRIIEDSISNYTGMKSLELPTCKDWFVKDIKECNVISANWINSEIFRISSLRSSVKQTDDDDNLSQLPVYSEKTAGCLGHLTLQKAPPTPEEINNLVIISKQVGIVGKPLSLSSKLPPLQTFKRSMPTSDDIPNKKKSTDIPQMNPIIVSTVSLAKTSEPFTVDQTPASEKPVILCKPTSLLMPSPVKEIVNTIHEPYNVIQPDTVPGPSQENGLLSSIENNKNNISLLLNFDGHNMTVSSKQKTKILVVKNGKLQSAPQVLGAAEIPPLIFRNKLYQNEECQVYMTPANSSQQSLCPYPIADAAPASEYDDIKPQLPLSNINNPKKPSIISQLIQSCWKENVILTTSVSVPTKYYKLLRFVLTIQEKQCDTRILLSSEFIVEVCMQFDGVFVLNVSDHSKGIDVMKWSSEFQSELISALKKPNFIETMRKVGKICTLAQKIYIIANVLEKFEVDCS